MFFKAKHIVPGVLAIVSLVLLILFLSWHYRIGMVRYFDADEYAHMHWAAKILEGKRPYIDFLTFFTPVFHWILSPAFASGWGTTEPFISARLIMFLIFVGSAMMTGVLVWQIRKSLWQAVLAGAILAFLPLPFDKLLEIRPDTPATLLMLLAVSFQIIWMKTGKRSLCFISGIFWSLSVLMLTKMLPNMAVGALVGLLYIIGREKGEEYRKKQVFQEILAYIGGMAIPVLLFGLWTLTLGNLPLVWYSLTLLPVEANKISRYFIMMPDLFFYPNDIYYGTSGWGREILVNHTLWVIGLLVGLIRLVAPLQNPLGRKNWLAELLVASQCFVQVLFYTKIVPLKHAQYLIPIAPFIAIYTADALGMVYRTAAKKTILQGMFIGVFLIGAYFLVQVFSAAHSRKLEWTNTADLSAVEKLYRTIPMSEPVLDLDGRMLYNPDGYYACCIPFGQFAHFLSRPLPSLPQALEDGHVKYINQGGLKRVSTLPIPDQQYIYGAYRSLHGDDTFLVRNDIPE